MRLQDGRCWERAGGDKCLERGWFSVSGGVIEGGMTNGATDDLGFKAMENPAEIHKLRATNLYRLSFDEGLMYDTVGGISG